MTTLFYLIIYDLPDTPAANKRRNRLHKLLCGYGKWTQFSVFECFLTGGAVYEVAGADGTVN